MRLIDADALKEHYNVPDKDCVFSYCDTIMRVIDEQPTIEPEVRHGRWILKILPIGGCDKIRSYLCSECDRYVNMKFDFCPNCGAQMDLRTPTEVQLDEADSVMMGDADNG